MIVLGIESSCDETGVAIVKNGKILANLVASSLKLHSKYGGVIPEIASRMQLESVCGVFDQAIRKAKIKPDKIDLIAVTSAPGLPGSLIVGLSFAKALALSIGKPIIKINHIHSHVYANILCNHKIKMPCVALVVSGGHTTLFYLKDFSKIQILGQTQDDACGEAFDKVAKIMGLGYPGGPLVEKLAKHGNKHKVSFACSGTNKQLDFSFSGIKTAVLYYLKGKKNTAKLKKDVAASFQECVINTLVNKSLLAVKLKNTQSLLLGGGVVANRILRGKFLTAARKAGINCYFPSIDLCMDNAAMVAGLAEKLYKRRANAD